jgi:hypothetical protein
MEDGVSRASAGNRVRTDIEFSFTGRRSMGRCALIEDEVFQAIDCPTGEPRYDASGTIILSSSIRRDTTIGVHYRMKPGGVKYVLRVFVR